MASSQKTSPNYTIRPMSRNELAITVEWAAAEGWNPGLHDANCFYAADEDGFLAGLLNGEPIACISAVKYDKTFGFIGFYIVRPEFRGQGYGWQIWQAGLARLKGCNMGLDGVVEQQENYIKSGFKLAHRNIRYEGSKRNKQPLKKQKEKQNKTFEGEIVPLSSLPLEKILTYDKAIFLHERAAFLQCWINAVEHRALGLVQQRQLVGYGVLRPCQQGYKIGPLFAETAQLAEALFLELIKPVTPDRPFYLDAPAVNSEAIALAEKYGMKSVFETARMYTQEAPSMPLNKIFGITTFELG